MPTNGPQPRGKNLDRINATIYLPLYYYTTNKPVSPVNLDLWK